MDNQQFSSMTPTIKTTFLPSIGDLFKKSFDVFKERVWVLAGLMAVYLILEIILVVAIVVGLLIVLYTRSESINFPLLPLPVIIGGLLMFVLAIIIGSWVQVSIIYAIKERDSKIGVKESLSRGWSRVGSYLWISILVGLATLGGLILLIIPGIIFSIWFSLSAYILVSEDLKGIQAISRSKQLVQGHWWSVFARFLVLGILTAVIMIILNMIPLGSIVSALFITPFGVVFGYLIYEDLKRVKGGEVEAS